MDQKTIAIDFDGVICQFEHGWNEGLIKEPPIEGASHAMEKLVQKGYRVVIFTTRYNPDLNGERSEEQKKELQKWLSLHGFEIKKHYHEITGYKPKAMAYIDDRGIRFTNWQDIMKYFI
jgi:histidinol phosphatase-like enzyme